MNHKDRWRLEQESPTDEQLRPFIRLDLETIRKFPEIRDMISAVYFVFDGDELLYVGASAGVANRLNDYYRDRRFGRIQWDHIAVLPVPDEFKFTIEQHYIAKFNPTINGTSTDD